VALVCGIDFPPLRLDVLKTIQTPGMSSAHGCNDKDCRYGVCKGNRVVLEEAIVPEDIDDEDDSLVRECFGFRETDIKIFIVHGEYYLAKI
jgi:hypothetical protein